MPHESLKHSSFFKELYSLPFLQSASELYMRTKESSKVLHTGFSVIEYSCTAVLDQLFLGSNMASRVDVLAGEGMVRLKERYPSIQKSPEEIQNSTSYLVRKTVRTAMKSGPGRVAIGGLDWLIEKTDTVLRQVKPRERSPHKRKTTRSTVHKVKKEHSYASEDSGACDAETKSSNKSQQTLLTSVKKMEEADENLLKKAYKLGIVFPLDVLVAILKSVRRYLGGKKRKPAKHDDVEAVKVGGRRKVSPRKRATNTFWGQLKVRASRFLGYKDLSIHGLDLDNGKFTDSLSPGKSEAEKKRKHDEILTDQGSDSENEGLANFDFDNYDSFDDPDYEPTDSETDVSEDISDEGESEGEIEMETVELRPDLPAPLVQIKDKKVELTAEQREQREKIMADIKKLGESKEKLTNGHSEKKDEKKQSPPKKTEISLKPEWQKKD